LSDFINGIGLNNVLLAAHFAVLLIAALVWSLKPATPKKWPNSPVTGAGANLVSIYFSFAMISDAQGVSANGTDAEWYLVFSALSAGILPVFTLFCFFVSGLIVGRAIAGLAVKR